MVSKERIHIIKGTLTWAVPCENGSSGICGERRPKSACAFAQSDQGLHCLLTELLDTTECMHGEQRPGCYFAHAHDDLNLRILRMFEGTFSLDAAHFVPNNLLGKYFSCAERKRTFSRMRNTTTQYDGALALSVLKYCL